MEITDSKPKSIGSNFIYSLFITIIVGLVNIVYPLIIGLVYGPETMGNFSVLFYWATLLTIPISNGIAPAISRYLAASSTNELRVIENTGIKLSFYYGIGMIVIYPFIGIFGFKLNAIEVLLVMAITLGLMIHYFYRNALQGLEKFKNLLIMEIISFAFFTITMIIFGILPYVLEWTYILDNYYFLFIPMLVFHISFLVCIIVTKRVVKFNIKSLFKFPSVTKKLLLYALFVGLGGLFAFGTSKIQVIISDLYLNELELGVLSFWDSAIAAITLLTVALGGLLVPRITNLQKFHREQEFLAEEFTNRILWAITLVVIPIAGLLFLLFGSYPNILDVLTLHKYNMQSYWLVVILLCFKEVNFLILTPIISYVLSSEKYVKFNPIASFVYSLSVIISWIIMVPRFGIFGFPAGIAIGGFIHSIITIIFVLIISKKKIGLHIISIAILYSLNLVSIILLFYINNIAIISVWSVICLVTIAFGLYKLVILLKDKRYSQKMIENELIEKSTVISD
ncbi:MAG: oligosaccharide flippase family protein [Asgard group archaeon]|nr:oligosaccharide flippase family protein [Asgard group archaeon]